MIKTMKLDAEDTTISVSTNPATIVEFRNTSFENIYIDFRRGADLMRLEKGQTKKFCDVSINKFDVIFESHASLDITLVYV